MKKTCFLIIMMILILAPTQVFGIFSVTDIANIRDGKNKTIVSNSTLTNEGIGHATYCPVRSRVSTNTNFPFDVGQVSGRTFKFEPINIQNIKNSEANVNLNALVTRVQNTTESLESAYQAYVIAKAHEDAKNAYWSVIRTGRNLTSTEITKILGVSSGTNVTNGNISYQGACSVVNSSTKTTPYILGCPSTNFTTTHSAPHVLGLSILQTTTQNFYIITRDHPVYNSKNGGRFSNTGILGGFFDSTFMNSYPSWPIHNYSHATRNMVYFQNVNQQYFEGVPPSGAEIGVYRGTNQRARLIPINYFAYEEPRSYTCAYVQRITDRKFTVGNTWGFTYDDTKVYRMAGIFQEFKSNILLPWPSFQYEYEIPYESPLQYNGQHGYCASYSGVRTNCITNGQINGPQVPNASLPRTFTYLISDRVYAYISEVARPTTGCAYPLGPDKQALIGNGQTIYINENNVITTALEVVEVVNAGTKEIILEGVNQKYETSNSLLPKDATTVSVRHYNRAELNDPNLCEVTRYTNVGKKYTWSYSWKNPITGSISRVNVNTATCDSVRNFTGSILRTNVEVKNLTDSWNSYEAAITDLKSCSTWEASFNTDPILSIHTQEGTLRTDYTTTNGRLQRIKEPVVSNSTTTCDPTRSSHCNTNLKVYQRTVNNGVVTITYVGISDKRFQITRKEQVSTETTRFELANNLNRYIYTDTGEIRNSVDATRLASGMYIDTGSPNFVTGVCTPTVRNGTITISYRNLGVTGRTFDTDLRNYINNNIPSARRSEYLSGNNFIYQSNYSLDTRLCPQAGQMAIYRPIKITAPFMNEVGASRTPGSNWNNPTDISRFITSSRGAPNGDVYQLTPLYTIDFTGANKIYLSRIKDYNKTNNYNFTTNSVKCSGTNGIFNNGTECRSIYLKTLIDVGVVTGCGTSSNWNACVGVR